MKSPLLCALGLSLAALLISGCITPRDKPSPDLLPQKLVIECGGFLGNSYHVEWKEDALVYRRAGEGFRWGWERKIHPSAEAWRKFWIALDAVSVWDWKSRYAPPKGVEVFDGTQWSVAIAHGNQKISSEGDNTYPAEANPKIGNMDRSMRFFRFREAVRELVDRDFY
jgi:hypothetical protein